MERRNARNARSNTNNYYIGDNLARKLADPGADRIRRQHERARERQRARRATLRKERFLRNVSVAIASVVVIGFCVMLLSTISRNNELTAQINKLDNRIEELKVLNDSKEFDIEGSVDLDYVIQVATQELGMVRSSAGQIITYETQNSEYVQHVAEIPTE